MADEKETVEPQSTDSGFATLISVCASCKESLQGREPLFLPCLHTYCKACIELSTHADGTASNSNNETAATATGPITHVTATDDSSTDASLPVAPTDNAGNRSSSNNNTKSASPDPGHAQNIPHARSNRGQDVKCKVCKSTFPRNTLIENVMAVEIPKESSNDASAENEEDSSSTDKNCTACEENVLATSFCQDCSEWLCDQCVMAHRRVRITKDHNIQSKDEALQERTEGVTPGSVVHVQRQMKCPVHKQELLVLFCETCDRLTCRDCQLQEHKDHKYHFLEDAASNYRMQLKSLICKVQEKQSYVENAKSLIETRRSEIREKESKVLNEIKIFALKLVAEINKRGKQLVSDLNALCSAKTKQLSEKNSEINGLSQRLEYAMKFAKYAAEKGNNAELLYTRRILVTELTNILQTRCEVPNPYHIVDIKFTFAPSFIAHVSKQGCITVDGVPYPGHRSQGQISLTSQPTTSPSGSASHPQGSQLQSQSQHAQSGSHTHSSSSSSNQLDRQAQQVLMNKVRQMHMQQQYREGMTGSRPLNPQGRLPFPPNQLGMRLPLGQGHPMPHQSSLVSSSNPHQNIRTGGQYFPPTTLQHHLAKGPSPPSSSHSQHAQRHLGMINLMQLQQQRTHRHGSLNHTHGGGSGGNVMMRPQSPSMQNPIVIQPTGFDEIYPTARGPPNAGQRLDCRMQTPPPLVNQLSSDGGQGGSMKQGDMERPSCSFAKKLNRRSEERAPVIDLRSTDIHFEEDPAALLEELSRTVLAASGGNQENSPPSTPDTAAAPSSTDVHSEGGSEHSQSRTPTPASVLSPQQEPHTNLQTPPRPPSQDSVSPTDTMTARVIGTISDFEDGLGCLENLLSTIQPDMDPEATVGLTQAAEATAIQADEKTRRQCKTDQMSIRTPVGDKVMPEEIEPPKQVESEKESEPAGEPDKDPQLLLENDKKNDQEPESQQTTEKEPEPEEGTCKEPEEKEPDEEMEVDIVKEPDLMQRATRKPKSLPLPMSPSRADHVQVKDKEIPQKSPQPRTLIVVASPLRLNARAPDKVMPELTSMTSDDPSEDYCAVCHNGGDLLCCDKCPKVFHVQCHVPTLPEAPSGEWTCTFCIDDDILKIDVPEPHGELLAGPSVGTKRRAPAGLTPREQKTGERILLELFAHESSTPYHEAVSKSIPNYYKIITQPMDLATVKNKLCRNHFNHYQSFEEFVQDVNLIFENCSIYNHPESEVGKLGKMLENFFESRLKHYVPYLDRKSLPPAVPPSEPPEHKKRKKERKKNNVIDSDDEDYVPE